MDKKLESLRRLVAQPLAVDTSDTCPSQVHEIRRVWGSKRCSCFLSKNKTDVNSFFPRVLFSWSEFWAFFGPLSFCFGGVAGWGLWGVSGGWRPLRGQQETCQRRTHLGQLGSSLVSAWRIHGTNGMPSLKLTSKSHWKIGLLPKNKSIVLQPSIFRAELLDSGSVIQRIHGTNGIFTYVWSIWMVWVKNTWVPSSQDFIKWLSSQNTI